MGQPEDRLALLLAEALRRGSSEHYQDSHLYDHEYQRRRDDVRYYRALAAEVGGQVLELGCGTGRLLLPLVRDGHRVVGVDTAAPMLARCQERLARLAPAARARARLEQADFRDLRLGRRFKLVLCPFNAFMHLYERSDVEAFLAGVRAHLAPGGVFAFDVMNPDLAWLSRDSTRRRARTRFRHPISREWMIHSTTVAYDAALQIAFMQIFYEWEERPRKRPRVVQLAQRYFFPLELEALLHYNGFELERRDGDFQSGAFQPDSEEQVCRCRLARRRGR